MVISPLGRLTICLPSLNVTLNFKFRLTNYVPVCNLENRGHQLGLLLIQTLRSLPKTSFGISANLFNDTGAEKDHSSPTDLFLSLIVNFGNKHSCIKNTNLTPITEWLGSLHVPGRVRAACPLASPLGF